jgi:hypothetical protein
MAAPKKNYKPTALDAMTPGMRTMVLNPITQSKAMDTNDCELDKTTGAGTSSETLRSNKSCPSSYLVISCAIQAMINRQPQAKSDLEWLLGTFTKLYGEG